METVEVVIKIPNAMYEEIKSGKDGYSNYAHAAIRNGIVLPKGHGALKDYHGIKSEYIRKMSITMSTEFRMSLLCEIIDDAPTVIEADREAKMKDRDCENCRHHVKRIGLEWGSDSGTYGCESWECKFEPKEKKEEKENESSI